MSKTATPHADLRRHETYRIAYNAVNNSIAGNLVAFLGYRTVFGARRALVRVLGTEEVYLVQPGVVISF